MPRGGTDKVVVDLNVVNPAGATVMTIKKQSLSWLEEYALLSMGQDLHIEIANGIHHENPEAYAQ